MLLSLIVIFSFAVRVAAWLYWGTGAIENEGAEYARIAQNVRNGLGYIGLAVPGPQVNFPPLFSWLIAGVSILIRSYEWAGRLIALVLGALIPLPIFGITSLLFRWRVGFIAAILSVLHPLLIHLSFSVYSEGPYFTVVLTAVYLAIRALDRGSIRSWLLVGAAFGISYLIRAEAASLFAITVLFGIAQTKGGWTVTAKRAAFASIAFLVIALPEIAFIYKLTGKVRLEVKSALFFYTANRISAAQKYFQSRFAERFAGPQPGPENRDEHWEAGFGIDDEARGTGTAMRSLVSSVREAHMTVTDFLLYGKDLAGNARVLFRQFTADWLGAPLLPALALLGAFRWPWRGPATVGKFLLIAIAVVPFIANPMALEPALARYSFIFVPLLCIWAANGLFACGLWARASISAAGWILPIRSHAPSYLVPGLLGAVMIVGAVNGVRRVPEFSESARPARVEKEIGLWIRSRQENEVRIMDTGVPVEPA